MQKWKTIKTKSNLISMMGLALLLLLAPCSVRNYIQAELGIPLTEVTSKSKTTIHQANCNTIETSEVIATNTKNTTQVKHQAILSSAPEFSPIAIAPSASIISNYMNGTHSKVVVPLYILYQKSQTYL